MSIRNYKLETREDRKRRTVETKITKFVHYEFYVHVLLAAHLAVDPILFSSNRTVDRQSVSRGTYNVRHDGIGGFQSSPFGFRLGFRGKTALASSAGVSYKLELGLMPGIKNYSVPSAILQGPVYAAVGVAIMVGARVPKFHSNSYLE